MLNININYPYPVIREYTDDYQSTEFIGELKVLLEPDGYAVHTNFEINNKGIQILLSKRILTYALEVQCVSTWFRKLYTIHENRVIRLDPQMIHERVELIPCIVVATSIEGFTNEDFAEEYQDMKFDLNAGDIMREYLIDHIGEYVFSRANVSEIIFIQIVELVGRTNKQLFLKNSLKINRMLYYMKIKTKSSRYKMWQQKEYYQLY